FSASRVVSPKDDTARKGQDHYAHFEKPMAGFSEQVFFHDLIADADGRVHVAIVPPKREGQARLAFCLDYNADELPRFVEWKLMGAGAYVVGLEPANCLFMRRTDERKTGTLATLAPGQRHTTE